MVEAKQLTKRYPHVRALDECTFSVARGEVFGLLGPNGAGKTTLIRILMGYLRPTAGSARIDGLDCYRDSVRVHQHVAYLPGDVRLFRRMRGCQVLDFFTQVRGQTDYTKAHRIAARLALDSSRRVASMSTGMRQKLAIAAVFAADTPLLILDEPTANLDPSVRGEILRMIQEARKDGKTVFFSSHVLSEVEEVCGRVVIMRQGKLVHTQVISELRTQHLIHAELGQDLPEIPQRLSEQVSIESQDKRQLTLLTSGELTPLLSWLASLPLQKIRIEPVGMRRVYDSFHGRQVDQEMQKEAS